MTADLQYTAVTDLREYAGIASRFLAEKRLEALTAPDGITLVERALGRSFTKDYDEVESPLLWPRTFDTSRWVQIAAFRDKVRVGGAIVARDTPDLHLLEGRTDLAVLWDIRVRGEWLKQGIGTQLFRAAESWALAQGCRELKVETQDINVNACRFYQKQGCHLSETHPHAYPDFPDEMQLIWRKNLPL